MTPTPPNEQNPRTATLCVHGARRRAPEEPVAVPVVRSSTFILSSAAYEARRAGRVDRSRAYSRETSPTVEAVERHLAVLDGAERSLLFASGMAALHALVMSQVERGDRVVAMRQIYGGTRELFASLLPRLGVELTLVDFGDDAALERELATRPRVFYCESLSNPLTNLADLARIRDLVEAHGGTTTVLVDGTLTPPTAQRCLALGADIVFHSATKYLGGHSDLIGGAVSGSDERLQPVWAWRNRAGGMLDPEPAYLIERGMKTLELRVRAQSENALAVARHLAAHPRVALVNYCGLETHPSHALAQKTLRHTGGLLSFALKDGDPAAVEFLGRLGVFLEAPSLGGVESLATRPIDMSHASLPESERARAGIVPGLVRLSVGIESIEDLLADLDQALEV